MLMEAESRMHGLDLDLGYPEFAESLRSTVARLLRPPHRALVPDQPALKDRTWRALVLVADVLAPARAAARRRAWLGALLTLGAIVGVGLVIGLGGDDSPADLVAVALVGALVVCVGSPPPSRSRTSTRLPAGAG
jgi:hypothetical protein